MPALYVRGLPPELREWLDREARQLGISTAAFVRLLIMSAKSEHEQIDELRAR